MVKVTRQRLSVDESNESIESTENYDFSIIEAELSSLSNYIKMCFLAPDNGFS